MAAFVLRTEGRLEYDDATYVTRGLFHAAQVQERGNLVLPRLAWSLTFEAPRPPLFHGLLATAVLLFGRQHFGAVLVAGTVVPLLALSAALILLASQAGGEQAPPFALLAYLATPAAWELATRPFVETTFAATVIGGVWFAYRRARGGNLVDEIGLGVCAGCGLLAKLLAPLFLGPAALVAAAACWRRESPRSALRFALVATLVAAALAMPWYARNWRQALEFASYARAHAPNAYAGPPWARPLTFVDGTLGWPMTVALVALAAHGIWRRSNRDASTSLLTAMTIAVAGVSAAVIATQPVFDPRYWLPAQALVACWVGVEVSHVWRVGGGRRRVGLGAFAAIAVALAIGDVASRPRPQTPWRHARVVAEVARSPHPPALLCTLGNTPDWNLAKLQLLVELAGLRPRPQTRDLLVNGRALGFEQRLAACDAVFALPVDRVPDSPSQRAFNADLAAGWSLLALHGEEFRAAPHAAAALGSRARPELFVRRQRGAIPGVQGR